MKIILTFLALFSVGILSAQSGATNTKQQDQHAKSKSNYGWSWEKDSAIPFTPPPDPIPVDGGISGLLLIGGLLGMSQLRRRKRKTGV